jgi:hypothetical protein
VANNNSAHARSTVTQSRFSVGQASGIPAAAFAVGLPLTSDVTSAVADKPNVSAGFTGATNTTFGLVVLGGRYPSGGSGAPRSMVSRAEFQVDLAQLPLTRNLRVGLIGSTSTGVGFDSLRFKILKEGVAIEDQTFASLAAAQTYFSDHLLDFGPIVAGVSGALDLTIEMTATSDANADSIVIEVLVANAGQVFVEPQMTGVSAGGGQFTFAFTAQAGQSYKVERTFELSPATWNVITNIPAPAITTPLIFSEPHTQPKAFYRLVSP